MDTSVHACTDTSKRKTTAFGQIPKDIMKRSDLSSDAKLLFAAVNMTSPGKESVAVSLRDLEQALPFKKSKIGNLLAKLIKAGLLIPSKAIRGQVKVYRINHQNWATVVDKSRKCPRCGESSYSLTGAGMCRKCIDGLAVRLSTGKTA